MRRFLKFILVVLWLSLSLGLQASQRFFNLTYEQVKIDLCCLVSHIAYRCMAITVIQSIG